MTKNIIFIAYFFTFMTSVFSLSGSAGASQNLPNMIWHEYTCKGEITKSRGGRILYKNVGKIKASIVQTTTTYYWKTLIKGLGQRTLEFPGANISDGLLVAKMRSSNTRFAFSFAKKEIIVQIRQGSGTTAFEGDCVKQ